ncbi:Transcription factor GAGA [Armadillidium nasatum]|uniref:Transcription factor GAGA n=1 Tax=Armadillidium nasatum TaxID=96803 RepID=A0A5N5T1P3_9CRUS|nr:Transcription factor GAGA [Armadillidium nasatum]
MHIYEMNGLLSLKWNSHCTTVLKKLRAIYSQDVLCDVTIACNGKFYPVHKLVLSICSEYFEEIFKQTHCKHPFIIMRDIKPIELEALLSYMYNGEVNVSQEILPGLISAAESLKIIGLAISEDKKREEDEINTKKRKFGYLKDIDPPENQILHPFPDKILPPERLFPNSLSQYETNKRSRRESMEMVQEQRENYKGEVIKTEPKDSNEAEDMNEMNSSCLSQNNSQELHSEALEDKVSLKSPLPLQIKEETDQDFSMAQSSTFAYYRVHIKVVLF